MAEIINIFSKEHYKVAHEKLSKQFNIKNVHALPKIDKIVLNMGIGAKVISDSNYLDVAKTFLRDISCQNPQVISARKSVSNFKLREQMKIGCRVTLRGERMYSFLAKLVCVGLIRVKQFQGLLTKNIDQAGNLNFGITDISVFPEILALHEATAYKYPLGMNVTIVTTTSRRDVAKALLQEFQIPFYN